MARSLELTVLVLACVAACGSSLPGPETQPHPEATRYLEVPYPPPAARVEIVPPAPQVSAVWIDGEWSWQGKQWVWEGGGWVIPPRDAFFAPWFIHRQANGRLFFTGGAWHARNGRPLPKPPIVTAARAGLGSEANGDGR